MPRVRIAYLSGFSPRKLGTGENRLVAFARAAAERGHAFTLFGQTPIHPDVSAALQAAAAMWRPLSELEQNPLRSSRDLARSYDVLQLNMIPPRGPAALAAYAAWPARVLFVDRVSGQTGEDTVTRPLVKRILDRCTMARVHQLAGITEYVRRRSQRRFGLPDDRTLTVYNGVDTDRFRPADGDRASPGPLRILTVANLIPAKGVDIVLRAVALLEPGSWSLRIAGEGPDLPRLESLATDLGIAGKVQFLGIRNDVPDLLRESDVAVHPAIWQEALGNTVLEAMATECCLVPTRVGGIPELARHQEEAWFVEPGNWVELADVLRMLAGDPARRSEIGRSARQRVLREFSLHASIARHLDWCEAAARGERMS